MIRVLISDARNTPMGSRDKGDVLKLDICMRFLFQQHVFVCGKEENNLDSISRISYIYRYIFRYIFHMVKRGDGVFTKGCQ